MKVRNYHKVELRDAFAKEQCVGCSVRVGISVEDGAEQLAMRILEIDPEGYSPKRKKPHEQAIFVAKGSGIIEAGDRKCELGQDDVLFIPANQAYRIENTGNAKLTLIITIPQTDRET